MSIKDRVSYRPLAPELVDHYNNRLDEEDDIEDDEIRTEHDIHMDRLISPAQFHHSTSTPSLHRRQSHHSPGKFGLKHLRLILYTVAIVLFLIFMAQLSTNDRTSKSNSHHHHSQQQHPYHHQIEGRELTTESLTSVGKQELQVATTMLPRAAPSAKESQPSNDIDSNQIVSQTSSSSTTSVKKWPAAQSPLHNGVAVSPPPVAVADPQKRPKYENYLSSVVKSKKMQQQLDADGEPIDDFHYPNREKFANSQESSLLEKSNHQDQVTWWQVGTRDSGNYVTVSNYIRAMKSFNHNTSITLTTQATTEFIYHTLELCKRWDGPLSVAIYAPGREFEVSLTLIKYMRQCLPAPLSACIRDKITWHFVWPKNHGLGGEQVKHPKEHLDWEHFSLFAQQDQCPKLAGPEPGDAIRQMEQKLRRSNDLYPNGYRAQNNLLYPINVLRNIARLAAQTHYILASDIELYPSVNLVSMFERYIKRHNILEEYQQVKKFAFTLPLFEVRDNVTAPKTKEELRKLFKQNDAIFFHKYVCDACQNFPHRDKWIESDIQGLENYHSPNDELVVFEVTQRDKSRSSWEPIYIGTNEDPLYDDRLSWDGRRDKMGQMYELCLQDYHLLIVGNGFMVHAPGIKHIDPKDVQKRIPFIRENNAIYDKNIERLKRKYANSSNIEKC